jgi:hypothetical protein
MRSQTVELIKRIVVHNRFQQWMNKEIKTHTKDTLQSYPFGNSLRPEIV